MHDWKQFYSSIVLDADEIKHGRGSLIDLMDHKAKEAVVELDRSLNHTLESMKTESPYRRYRRGKNRCWICGLKLGTEEHKPYA